MSKNTGLPKEAPARKARIEIIPLIDVVFFLLATFVLFTLSLNKIVSIPLNLPRAVPPTSAAQDEDKDTVILQVSGEGSVFWNKEAMDISQVKSQLIHHKSTAKNPRVLLTGDEKALYGTTIEILDQIREAGITQVSIETAPRASGK